MGVERILPEWKVSLKIYRELKSLTRERQRLVENRTAVKNSTSCRRTYSTPHENGSNKDEKSH